MNKFLFLAITGFILLLAFLSLTSAAYTITNLSTDAILENIDCEGGGKYCHLGISSTSPFNHLALYLPFDDNVSATTAYDWSYGNDNGAYTNAVWNNSGIYGGAAIFDGNGDYITINNVNWNNTGTYPLNSLTFWIKFFGNFSNQIPFDLATVGYTDFYFYNTTCIGMNTANGEIYGFNPSSFNLSNWTHFALTGLYDGAYSQNVKIYANGILQTMACCLGNCDNRVMDLAQILLGNLASEGQNYWLNGTIDEFMVFNTSLTAAQITQIYQQQAPRFFSSGNHSLNQSITSGNNQVNVSIIHSNQQNATADYTNLSLKIWNNGDNTWTAYQNLSVSGKNYTFDISNSATSINLSFLYNPEIYKFFSPVLKINITIENWTGGDAIYPIFFSYEDNNASIFNNGLALFNVSIANTNGTAFLQINSQNYTARNTTSQDKFNVSLTLSTGVYAYQWLSWGNGSNKNFNISATRYYTIDTTPPNLTIVYPTNTSYNVNVSSLNYTAGSDVQACWYSLNLGTTNTTITCGTNLTGLTSSEGSNTWLVWANDTSNNVNISQVTFAKDTIFPIFSSYQDNNGTLTVSGTALFNVTIANTNATVFLQINNQNYTARNTTAQDKFNVSLTLTTGVYAYQWLSWGNGSSSNFNISATRYYTVKAYDIGLSSCQKLNTSNVIYGLTQNVQNVSTCFNITANNITLDCQGFEINYSSAGTLGYGVVNFGQNFTTIKNCVIKEGTSTTGNKYAVYFNGASNGTIQNNTIRTLGGTSFGIGLISNINSNTITSNNITTLASGARGIWSGGCNYCNITSNNIIAEASRGIQFEGDGGNYNTLTNNIISSLSEGIVFTGYSVNTIQNNTITTSGGSGYGVYLLTSSNSNTLSSNSITTSGASGYGVYLLSSSNSNTLTSNTITTSNTDGVSHGIYLSSSSSNNFTSNNITTNSMGFFLYGTTAGHFSNRIDNDNYVNNKLVNVTDKANNLVISGENMTKYGQVIIQNSRNITITNSNFSDNGITIANSSSVIVNSSLINLAKGTGAYLIYSSYNNLTRNTINTTGASGHGVFLQATSNNNVIDNNNINTTGASASGIYFQTTVSNNVITSNRVLTSSATGIYLYTGGSGHTVLNNNITTLGSDGYGIYLYGSSSNITSNTITTSGGSSFGIQTSSSNRNSFIANTITTTGSTAYGISLADTSSHNTITSNTITTSGTFGYGVYMNYGTNNSLSVMRIITNNTNAYALYQYPTGSNFTLTDSILNSSASGVQDFYIASAVTGGTWNFTNVTRADGTPITISWTAGANGTLNMHNYLDVYANYTNSSIAGGANVSSWNNAGTLLFSNLTDASGNIARQTILAYMQNATQLYPYSNHTINATTTYTQTQSTNMSEGSKFLVFMFDATLPNATLLSPADASYTNATSINFTANISDTGGSGLKNATLYVYNQSTEQIVNQTTTTFENVVNTIVGTVVNLVQGIYKWFYRVYDYASNYFQTGNYTLTIDTSYPQIQFVSPTPNNNTGRTSSFIINLSIIELNLANITYNWNGSLSIYNTTNSSLTSINSTLWILTINQTGLVAGNTYTYNLTAKDLASNSNSTETRIIKGNSPPTFNSFNYTPNNTGDLDPATLVTITVNLSDLENNFDSAILQWRNSSSLFGINNITMTNSTAILASFIMNASFSLPSYQDNITLRVMTNDTIGEISVSSNYTLTTYWDCTWLYSTDISQTSGWDQNKEIGNITINNTGDIQHSSSNCSLDFRLTYDLTEGRIYFDNDYVKPSNTYTIPAKNNRTILVNATFATEIKQETTTITLTEFRSRSNNYSANISATLVTNQQGPYLYEKITSYPSSVYLTAGNFNIVGYLRNLMGSSDININNTAYNVSFYLVLPSGLTNSSGAFSTNYTNITDNSLNYLNTNITFSNLATMTSGIKTFTLRASGYNLSGSLITDAYNNTVLTENINITFLCYNVSDSVYVTACGSLDGDYTPSTTTVTAAAAGGGGGGASVTSEVTSQVFELLRGKQQEFDLEFKNKYNNTMRNIKISVSGESSEYIKLEPETISKLEPYETKIIKVTISAPKYFTSRKYILKFNIEGKLIVENLENVYREEKKITLLIVEFSGQEAIRMFNQSLDMLKEMNSSGMHTKQVSDLFALMDKNYKDYDYIALKSNYEKIKLIYENAKESSKLISQIEELVKKAEKEGISVIETKRLLYLAKAAFERGDFQASIARIKESQFSYALETKGEFNPLYYVKNHPIKSSALIIILTLISYSTFLIAKLRLYKRKLGLLDQEEKLLIGLMKVIQKECFEETRMSMEEYEEAINQYELRLNKIIQDKINTETKLAYLFKIKGKNQALFTEHARLIELIKETQKDYMERGKLETRIYENMLKSYSSRLSEIEEEIALVEAKKALSNKGFIGKRKNIFTRLLSKLGLMFKRKEKTEEKKPEFKVEKQKIKPGIFARIKNIFKTSSVSIRKPSEIKPKLAIPKPIEKPIKQEQKQEFKLGTKEFWDDLKNKLEKPSLISGLKSLFKKKEIKVKKLSEVKLVVLKPTLRTKEKPADKEFWQELRKKVEKPRIFSKLKDFFARKKEIKVKKVEITPEIKKQPATIKPTKPSLFLKIKSLFKAKEIKVKRWSEIKPLIIPKSAIEKERRGIKLDEEFWSKLKDKVKQESRFSFKNLFKRKKESKIKKLSELKTKLTVPKPTTLPKAIKLDEKAETERHKYKLGTQEFWQDLKNKIEKPSLFSRIKNLFARKPEIKIKKLSEIKQETAIIEKPVTMEKKENFFSKLIKKLKEKKKEEFKPKPQAIEIKKSLPVPIKQELAISKSISKEKPKISLRGHAILAKEKTEEFWAELRKRAEKNKKFYLANMFRRIFRRKPEIKKLTKIKPQAIKLPETPKPTIIKKPAQIETQYKEGSKEWWQELKNKLEKPKFSFSNWFKKKKPEIKPLMKKIFVIKPRITQTRKSKIQHYNKEWWDAVKTRIKEEKKKSSLLNKIKSVFKK